MHPIETIVNNIISEYGAYLSQAEPKASEKEKCIAKLEVQTYELAANREIVEKYFVQNMKERDRLLQCAQKILDKAMQTGDCEYANIARRVIEVINKKSPFNF